MDKGNTVLEHPSGGKTGKTDKGNTVLEHPSGGDYGRTKKGNTGSVLNGERLFREFKGKKEKGEVSRENPSGGKSRVKVTQERSVEGFPPEAFPHGSSEAALAVDSEPGIDDLDISVKCALGQRQTINLGQPVGFLRSAGGLIGNPRFGIQEPGPYDFGSGQGISFSQLGSSDGSRHAIRPVIPPLAGEETESRTTLGQVSEPVYNVLQDGAGGLEGSIQAGYGESASAPKRSTVERGQDSSRYPATYYKSEQWSAISTLGGVCPSVLDSSSVCGSPAIANEPRSSQRGSHHGHFCGGQDRQLLGGPGHPHPVQFPVGSTRIEMDRPTSADRDECFSKYRSRGSQPLPAAASIDRRPVTEACSTHSSSTVGGRQGCFRSRQTPKHPDHQQLHPYRDAGSISSNPGGHLRPSLAFKWAPKITGLMQSYDYATRLLDLKFGSSPTKACYVGVIAPATEGVIDVDRVLSDFPDLGDHFRWFYDALFLRTVIDSSKKVAPGPSNVKLQPHVDRLIELNIVEPIPRNAKGAWFSGAFTVPKKQAGHLRFILSCVTINAAVRADVQKPPCSLPSYSEMITTIMPNGYIMEYDFRSFFFQFPLPPECRNYFSFRVPGGIFRMTRLPMGFSLAPQVAQALSRKLGEEASKGLRVSFVPWIDNLVFTAPKPETLREVDIRFRRLCKRYNVVIGEFTPPVRKASFLGLEVDLSMKCYRLSPSWVQKVVPALRAVLALDKAPIKVWWRASGCILWRHLALCKELSPLVSILFHWMSVTAKEDVKARGWKCEISLPSEVREKLIVELQVLADNERCSCVCVCVCVWVVPAIRSVSATVVQMPVLPEVGVSFAMVTTIMVFTAVRWLGQISMFGSSSRRSKD
eukprot:TRINITY_DN2805_c0_g1_i5.p1 TRINITY_DN2805_c0_g1~~TRINITY_DN2805_c0_g1_i5.p1  ORF type:complete len:934 (+),score=21.11 TRINITY_DN2805_c0_g1_i5:197-2803(+)